jgi:hypothetical protein
MSLDQRSGKACFDPMIALIFPKVFETAVGSSGYNQGQETRLSLQLLQFMHHKRLMIEG